MFFNYRKRSLKVAVTLSGGRIKLHVILTGLVQLPLMQIESIKQALKKLLNQLKKQAHQ